MLCNKTMRAALAPVIGLLGVVLATGASAQIDLTAATAAARAAGVQKYAAETLSGASCVQNLAGTACANLYKINATDSTLQVRARTDVLLNASQQNAFYLRVDLEDGAGFAENLGSGESAPLLSSDPITTDAPNPGWNEINNATLAFRGKEGNASVIYKFPDGADFALGTGFAIDLSSALNDGDNTNGTEVVSKLAVAGAAGSTSLKMRIYSSLESAVDQGRALFTAEGAIVKMERAVGGDITGMLATSDVSTLRADGGPFRRFASADTATDPINSGVLAKGEVEFKPGLLHAQATTVAGKEATAAIVGGVGAKATAEAGSFAVGTIDGGPNPKHRQPWRVSSTKACTDGKLKLGGPSELATYDDDPDGDDGPLRKGDYTPAGIAAATEATGSADFASGETGDTYFCVQVDGAEDPISADGDPEKKDAFMLTLTPTLKLAKANRVVNPAPIGPKAAGAIDRNGTTVHLTYLSTHEAYNQRLVLVNRGGDGASFWVDDNSFNLEDGVTLDSNTLQGEIPANGRLVMRVQDHVTLTGKTRGAATINVAAPTRNVDVMTIQVHPGTGQIDTTVYQHAN